MNSSSQQNQYPPYDPSHYNYHQQQQNLPYYNTPSNYSNSYVPQQQWHHPPGQPIGLNPVAAVVVAALAQQLTQFSTCYPQPQPVISGPAFGSPAFSGHGSGPSGLVSHAGQSLDKGGGQHSGGGRDIFSEVPPRTGGSGPSSRKKGHNHGLGGLRCELCKVDCATMGMVKHHVSSKRHRNYLNNLKANANRTVCDFQTKENPSGYLKQETTVTPDNLLVDEKTKQNLPENIPLDTVPTENKLENEHKINNAQLTDSSKRGQHSGCGRDIFGEVPPRTGGSGPSSRRKGHNRGLGGLRCELCKVDCGSMGMLEQHESGKRHRNNLKKLEANADTTVSDFRNKENPSGDLKQESTVKPYNLLVDEKTKQNLPGNISLDIVPTGNKLENEHKINNAQQADLSKDADRDLLSKKPMMNQLENQSRGLKRGWLVVEKKKNVPKVKRQLIEPPKPEVVIPLMCDLCNVKCDTREILTRHRLSKKHMSKLKCFDVRLGLQALYPPNPVTHTLYHLQGVQQVLNGAQASDPTVGSLILPRTDNAGPP